MRWMAWVLAAVGSAGAGAQWTLQESHTTASLRGVHSVGNGVAWASGTGGTVLRTMDGGKNWQVCAVPPGAEGLDFRGVQGFDERTAIVMSSGKGDLSRLYKTVDGCGTWKLVATNPDGEGFWDAVRVPINRNIQEGTPLSTALIIGDSVGNELRVWEWKEGWEERELELSYEVRGKSAEKESSFASSNSILEVADTPQMDRTWKFRLRWASNTPDHAFLSYVRDEQTKTCEPCREEVGRADVPVAGGNSTSGIFSFHFRTEMVGVAVGGDFTKPAEADGTSAYSRDGGFTWRKPTVSPHGYRSSVAYDNRVKVWITVGPNGTDVSTDAGRNWRALKPGAGEAADADRNWNALSLPFVVGPKGRIGVLRADALRRP